MPFFFKSVHFRDTVTSCRGPYRLFSKPISLTHLLSRGRARSLSPSRYLDGEKSVRGTERSLARSLHDDEGDLSSRHPFGPLLYSPCPTVKNPDSN